MNIIVIIQLVIAVINLIAKLRAASINAPYLPAEVRAAGWRAAKDGNLATLHAMKARLETILKKGECPECNGSGLTPDAE